MVLECDSCNAEITDFDLDRSIDIGINCPSCGSGTVYLNGYCPDCHNNMQLTESTNNGMYTCDNCRTQLSIRQVLLTEPTT